MAITILREGVDPNYDYGAVCPNCKSVLKYKYEDAIKNAQVATWHEFHITCPVCGHYFSHNSNHTVKEDLISEGSTIWRTTKGSSIIPEGCRAYGLYMNGAVLEAHEFNKIIPNHVPTLIVGTCTEIEILTGTSIEDPYKQMSRINIQDLNIGVRTEYYTILPDFSVVKVNNLTDKFGITPQSFNESDPTVSKFDLETE